MRSDMGRVVIERPRAGSSNESPKVRHFPGRIDEEGDFDGLTRLPSSANKINGFVPRIPDKSFTDVLGPLRRYLHKNVGRPWDKIYSEATASLKSGGWGVHHVFTNHFLGEVDRTVYEDETGALVSLSHSNRFGRLPVWGFYVHPRTGLLCHARPPRRRVSPRRDPNDVKLIQRKDGAFYVRIKDLWFIARYEEAIAPSGETHRWPNRVSGGKLWICRIEKSCNKKDLREIRHALL